MSFNKERYGEVFTPSFLVEDIMSIIPSHYFRNAMFKWLDVGGGDGIFSTYLYNRLFEGLKDKVSDEDERREHILENMIYISEIQDEHLLTLREKGFINVISGNFLDYNPGFSFDFIIGNPPYHVESVKKVPTNSCKDKKKDGITIWPSIIRHCDTMLRDGGQIVMIIPSIWMKPDKEKMYDFITKYKIHSLSAMTNQMTLKIFKTAQTPTCFFRIEKVPKLLKKYPIQVYQRDLNKYISYVFRIGDPLPTSGYSIISKIHKHARQYGSIQVEKTNMPPKATLISSKKSFIHCYKNIRTAHLSGNDVVLVTDYSDRVLKYNNLPKVIFPHKMYGFPFLDEYGEYGISNRDSYVYLSNNIDELRLVCNFFSTDFALYLFDCTRYRMKYLEKYIFNFIPNLLRLPDFPKKITTDSLCDYFEIDEREIIPKTKYSFQYRVQ